MEFIEIFRALNAVLKDKDRTIEYYQSQLKKETEQNTQLGVKIAELETKLESLKSLKSNDEPNEAADLDKMDEAGNFATVCFDSSEVTTKYETQN